MKPRRSRAAVSLSFLLLSAALLLGCGEKPDPNKLALARTALDTAEAAEAPRFAADEWQRARAAFAAAEAEFQAQEKRVFRASPDLAHQLAAEATTVAVEARDAASEGMRKALAELRRVISSAESRFLDVETEMVAAVRCHRRQGVAGVEDLARRFKELRAQLETARQSFDDGRYEESRAASAAVESDGAELLEAVRAAAWAC